MCPRGQRRGSGPRPTRLAGRDGQAHWCLLMYMIGVHACTHTYIALVCAKRNNTLITLFGFPLE